MPSRTEGTRVAVYGAGIAGLAAAHELAELGYAVDVYEATAEAGGFFRSARLRGARGMPTEYSWHGMGPWYHNVFDILKRIPFDDKGSVYARALSRPIDFGIFPDSERAEFYDHGLRSIPKMFRLGPWESVRWAALMLRVWTSRKRSEEIYACLNAAECWRPLLKPPGYRAWRACFGPWIGSDWTKVSLHHCGHFFRRQLITQPTHVHPADEDGGPWTQGAGDGWLLLRGPSSEVWFDKWVPWLESRGVRFHWGCPLRSLQREGSRIAGATLWDGQRVVADKHIVAINPFSAADVVERSPGLPELPVLRELAPLVRDGPHVQVSVRIAFAEPIHFPRPRTAVVLSDTEFNLTLFAQEQAWRPEVSLGEGVASLWTVTSCAGNLPGRLYKLPAVRCTQKQFLDEVRAQIWGCSALDALIREANGGRSLRDFTCLKMEVWHEWEFSEHGLGGPQPKWVTTTNNQQHRPPQATPLENLFLAGAHTRTEADVWSIEGAVESGRRAARLIDPRVRVLSQYDPPVLRWLMNVDDWLYDHHLPHVIPMAGGLLIGIFFVIALFLFLG